MQSSHPVECICRCWVAHTGWPPVFSWGTLQQQQLYKLLVNNEFVLFWSLALAGSGRHPVRHPVQMCSAGECYNNNYSLWILNLCCFGPWHLQALEDIQYAIKMLKQGDRSENPVDRHYHSLECQLAPLDHSSDTFKVLVAMNGPPSFLLLAASLCVCVCVCVRERERQYVCRYVWVCM